MRFIKSLALATPLLFPAATWAQSEREVADFFGPGAGASDGGGEASGVGAYQIQSQSGVLGIMPGGGQAQGGGDIHAVVNVAMPSSLEEAIDRAMKGNPEIALAVANRRQAEMAENLTRNKVASSVVQTFKQWQIDQRALQMAEEQHRAATISESELLTAKEAAMKSETALQFLLGGYSAPRNDAFDSLISMLMRGQGSGMGMATGAPGGSSQGTGSGDAAAGTPDVGGDAHKTSAGPAATGPGMAAPAGGGGAVEAPAWRFDEQLKQNSGAVEYDGLPIEDFAKLMSETLNVPVIVDRQTFEAAGGLLNYQLKLSLNSADLTWNDVLTAIADTHDLGFLKRDYGLLITTKDKAAASRGFGGFMGSMGGGGGYGGGGYGGGGGAF